MGRRTSVTLGFSVVAGAVAVGLAVVAGAVAAGLAVVVDAAGHLLPVGKGH